MPRRSASAPPLGAGIETTDDQPISTANIDVRPLRWLGLRLSADVGWASSEAACSAA
jgi:hypothetical protein